MRELFCMYVPEYTITGKVLKNIAALEYSKAVVVNTTILPTLEKQLQKEAEVEIILHNLAMENLNADPENIKRFIDNISEKTPREVKNLYNCLNLAYETARSLDLEEEDIKNLYSEITEGVTNQKQGKYRNVQILNHIPPEEILAEMVELTDWYNGLDSRETHPVIRAGILKGRIEQILPFDHYNFAVGNFAAMVTLHSNGYDFKEYLCPENYYLRSRRDYENALRSVEINDGDVTQWLEYFTEAYAYEATNIQEKVIMMARDTKVAKASGNVDITPRQERIVEYLQDYGILQNKDFSAIFPDISEDSVLRDLKVLLDKGIVVKKGRTKSSRYELK